MNFFLDGFQNQWFFNFLFRHASVLQAKFLSVTPSNEPTETASTKRKGDDSSDIVFWR